MKVYKPNNKNTGSAVQFEISDYKGSYVAQVSVCPQTGPIEPRKDTFKWKENKLFFSIGENEIGSILSHIRGLTTKPELKLVHKFNDKISSLTLKRPETEQELQYGNWMITVDKGGKRISVPINVGELMYLERFMINVLDLNIRRNVNDRVKGEEDEPSGNTSDQVAPY